MNAYRLFITVSSIIGLVLAYVFFIKETKTRNFEVFLKSQRMKIYLLKGYVIGLGSTFLILMILSD